MGLPPDLIELLSVFAEERVDYLLIGGQALAPPSRIDLMKEVPGGDFDAAYSARAWPAAARELRIGTFGIRDMEERVDRVVALACHEAAAL